MQIKKFWKNSKLGTNIPNKGGTETLGAAGEPCWWDVLLISFFPFCASGEAVTKLRALQRRQEAEERRWGEAHTLTGISIALSGSYWHLVYPADWVNSLTNDSHLLSQSHHLACGLSTSVCVFVYEWDCEDEESPKKQMMETKLRVQETVCLCTRHSSDGLVNRIIQFGVSLQKLCFNI